MKILQVTTRMNIGGIETFLMNVLKKIDKEKYEFTFLTYRNENFDYEDEIIENNGKIIRISNPKKVSPLRHYKELISILKKEKYNIVHCHTYFDSAIVMMAAKKCGVPIRITHSHTTLGSMKVGPFRRLKWIIGKVMIKRYSTNLVACSKEAGKALFDQERFLVIPNGIDFDRFQYNKALRKKYRAKFEINKDTVVVGHVGRLDEAKNHSFLLDIFKEYLKINSNALLVLIGSGEKENEIISKINQLDISKNVRMLGNQMNVNELINIFDVFVFPSIYEGLPLSVLEVQANGLPSIISDRISKEVAVSDCIKYMSLSDSKEDWAKMIDIKKDRLDTLKVMKKSIYSIDVSMKMLLDLYNEI